MKQYSSVGIDSFIGGWYIDPALCEEVINHHKNTEQKGPGLVGGRLDPSVKDSIDCTFYDLDLRRRYRDELQKCVNLYSQRYPEVQTVNRWRIIENENIQYYPKGGGFKIFHSERMRGCDLNVRRFLVFMTYLNDVHDDGETEFLYQKIKVKPEKGLTLIWPSDWTHTHRGIPSPTEEKYIVTGWFSFERNGG